MGKSDFDIDFDFEEEFGFDPKAFLGTEEYDDTIDLDAFSDEELGLKDASAYAPQEEEDEQAQAPAEELPEVDENVGFLYSPDTQNEPLDEEPEYDAEEPLQQDYAQEEEYDGYGSGEFQEEEPEENEMYEQPDQQEEYDEEELFEDDDMEADAAPPKRQRKARKPITMPKINLPKLSTPKFLTRFFDLYFAPLMNKSLIEEPQDPNNPRRRRRKSKAQIFKEVYLPPILVCVCLILVMSFAIGALSNAIAEKKLKNQLHQDELQASQDAATLREQQYQSIMAQADTMATQYNYSGAISLLESFGDDTDYPDLIAKKAELVTAQQQLVEHREPSLIPNLSFHVLIEDLPRAMNDETYGGSYNKNFVSTGEFKAILNQLYSNGYVLVNFESFVESGTDTSGNEQFMTKAIYLPAGKKPIMLTETMVNYFAYMVDPDKDGVLDGKGGGFANKLVLQNGQIKAAYVDGNGQSMVGDYDFVPILESFIAEHPDFSYQGARATLAVTGDEGIFGYRINTANIASKGQAYYDQECADAKEIVQALRDLGYRLACYTYGNKAYRDMSSQEIQADLTLWTQQITPVIGQVDTLVFARTSNLADYSGTTLGVLQQTGFRYFVSNNTQPWAEVNSTYVRQNRLMVTGQNMQHYTNQFTGIFDCSAVLDVNVRGNVPN